MATPKLKKEFKEILENENIFDEYVTSLKLVCDRLDESEREYKINELNSCIQFDTLIFNSFIWEYSPQGHYFWEMIYKKYSKYED